ncbi:hypothetical protein SEA_KUWABARA_75 [Gordonia phage Kuwabara]|nr:hypothetical protein SEA_KUWABARA_75 [Gordonia phage Kuwabara]
MILQSAIDKHRAEQDAESWWSDDWGPLDDFAPYAMARTVGALVAGEFGELVSWDTFDNCREHGLTVRTPGGWTFCWYEHRNSDTIHIEGCPSTEVQSFGPYGGESKYDTLAEFWPETYDAVAVCLIEMVRHTIERGTVRADLKKIGVRHGNVQVERQKQMARFEAGGSNVG